MLHSSAHAARVTPWDPRVRWSPLRCVVGIRSPTNVPGHSLWVVVVHHEHSPGGHHATADALTTEPARLRRRARLRPRPARALRTATQHQLHAWFSAVLRRLGGYWRGFTCTCVPTAALLKRFEVSQVT